MLIMGAGRVLVNKHCHVACASPRGHGIFVQTIGFWLALGVGAGRYFAGAVVFAPILGGWGGLGGEDG